MSKCREGVVPVTRDNRIISVVVPVYNESEMLQVFHERLSAVLDSLSMRSEIVYVNDGSFDDTLDILEKLEKIDERVAIVDLTRNFGKEAALTAGLDHAMGDAVIVIDADLQDPPELIPTLIEYWGGGYDVVYAKRTCRIGESCAKKVSAFIFYRVIHWVSRVYIPQDTGDFRLLSRRAVDGLKKLHEHHRFMKGLFAWIGYSQIAVPYQRDARYAGKSKWNYWKLFDFALDGITSFTTAPLRLASCLGLLTAITAFIYAAYIVYKTIAYGEPVRGYPSLMAVVLFIGGIQLITIGIIGEYLGRLFDETKNRPLYLVKKYKPACSKVDVAALMDFHAASVGFDELNGGS